jgi:hypothetical protein
MHVGNYLGLVDDSERQLAEAFSTVADHHGNEPDIKQMCQLLAGWPRAHRERLAPLIARYGQQQETEPEQLRSDLFGGPRTGALALVRDLHDVWLLANETHLCWTVLRQAAQALRDHELLEACDVCDAATQRELAWLLTRIKQGAPQALIVAA